MNLVVFASDAKGLSSLNSIINEASERGINLFAMICQDTQLRYPLYHKDKYQILTNCENIDPVYSQTLGVTLPFKPDWLLVNRERWDPETSIISEFKQKFKSKIGLIEPNSWILGGVEAKLETYSRNRFKNIIDVFFTHSTHSVTQQNLMGFEGNTKVVGNPKYDLNLTLSIDEINQFKNYYNIDPNKKQVLLFSLINSNRDKINNIFKTYINQHPEYQYFYKPYPGEPFDAKFKNDYYPQFFLENCTPILEETHIWGMFNICSIHIGCLSSISHSSLLLNKHYIDVSKDLEIENKYLDVSNVLKTEGVGIESNINMWMRSFGFNNQQQLIDLFPNTLLEQIKKSNQKVWDNLDKPQNLLTLFDDFNDGKASKRIIDYIENEK